MNCGPRLFLVSGIGSICVSLLTYLQLRRSVIVDTGHLVTVLVLLLIGVVLVLSSVGLARGKHWARVIIEIILWGVLLEISWAIGSWIKQSAQEVTQQAGPMSAILPWMLTYVFAAVVGVVAVVLLLSCIRDVRRIHSPQKPNPADSGSGEGPAECR
jgi:hypothetical protein